MIGNFARRGLDASTVTVIAVILLVGIGVPAANLYLPAASPLHMPSYLVPLLGKYLTFALLALSVGLIWGFAGILSLGHGAFFALGGYAMGMYLMRQIGSRGVYANPVLPDFMVFLNWKELPWYWHGFDHFWFAALMVVRCPALLAFVFGWFAFRSRVTGVYLSIITQAMTYRTAARLLPQRHGLRRQQRPYRFQGDPRLSASRRTRPAQRFSSARRVALALAVFLARAIVRSKFGKVLVGDPRCRKPDALPRLPRGALQAGRLRPCRPAWPASPARSTCRRSASSTPANSRRPTRSRR